MKSNPQRDIPEEDVLERLLKGFKPQPTERLRRKITTTPWNSAGYAQQAGLFARKRQVPRLAWGLAFTGLLLIVLVIGFVRPVQAIARQIIFSFIHSSANQIELQVTPANPGELFNLNDPANFTLTISEAQQVAGFPVQQISPTPAGMSLVGARYEAGYEAVIVLYQSKGYTLFLTQRSLGKGLDVFSIGETARVELLKVGSVQAEFVRGGWKVAPTQPTPAGQISQTPVYMLATWDDSLAQSTLRWQTGSMSYELRALGENGPSQSDLILWANGLK